MKKNIISVLLLITLVCIFSSCAVTGGSVSQEPAPEVGSADTVNIYHSDITITDKDTFDCKSLFRITVNGEEIIIEDSMIDVGAFDPDSITAGEYTLSVEYISSDGEVYRASAVLKVIHSPEVVAEGENAEIFAGDTSFDVKSMFSLTADAEEVQITDDMLELGGFDPQNAKEGQYDILLTYTSSDGREYKASAVLTVCAVWIGPF